MSDDKQTPQNMSPARVGAAGAQLGLGAGLVVAIIDPIMWVLGSPVEGAWAELPVLLTRSLAVVLPLFALIGAVWGILVAGSRSSAPAIHKAMVRAQPFILLLAIFGHFVYWELLTSGSIDLIRFISYAVVTLIVGHFAYNGLCAWAASALSGRRKSGRIVAASVCMILWGSAMVLSSRVTGAPASPFPSAIADAREMTATPNVVLIVLDTVRADHLSCYGYYRETTPHIDAFASDARVYKNVLSPSCWTLPAHASFFTGLPTSAHGVTWKHQALDREFVTLAEQLQGAGYQTLGLSANSIVAPSRFFDQGFDTFENPRWMNDIEYHRRFPTIGERVLASIGLPHEVDPDVFTAATALNTRLGTWFRDSYEGQRPFFIFLNYIEAHVPYTHRLPEKKKWASEDAMATWNEGDDFHDTQYINMYAYTFGLNTLTPGNVQELEDLYDEEILYVDRKVGEVLQFLEDAELEENTLVIVTSDHGEHFGEHHLMDHQYSLYEALVRVPLIVKYDKQFAPGSVDHLVQSHDIYPTILQAAGLDFEPTAAYTCRSLLDESASHDRLGISEYLAPYFAAMHDVGMKHYPQLDFSPFWQTLRVVQRDGRKLIRGSRSGEEIYDLREDPMERQVSDADTGALSSELDTWLNSFPHYTPRPASEISLDAAIPEEELEVLRSLGYIR